MTPSYNQASPSTEEPARRQLARLRTSGERFQEFNGYPPSSCFLIRSVWQLLLGRFL